MYGAVQRLAQIAGDRQPGDDLGGRLVEETEGVQLAQPNLHLTDQDPTTGAPPVSNTVVRCPARVKTMAQPTPIDPPPTTPMRPR